VGHEAFDLLTGGFAEGLGTAEIDGVGLDEVRIELVLADELAESVADLGTAIVSVLSVDWLGWDVLRLPGGRNRFGKRADLLDRADADTVGLAKGPVDRTGLRHAHLGAVDQGGNIGGIGIAKARESSTSPGLVHRRLEGPTLARGIAERLGRLNVDASAPLAAGHAQESRVGDIPSPIEQNQVAR
jgi:hypothetical protein